MYPHRRTDEEACEEMFGPDADIKADIIAHPLFEQLLAAHVACLRVGTPLEEQHIIDSGLPKRHRVAAKYLALCSFPPRPAENKELDHFMVYYTLLLQSLKEKILEHLDIEASKAIFGCQEIEQELFNLTGVSIRSSQIGFSTMTGEDQKFDDDIGISQLHIKDYIRYNIQKTLRDHVRMELKKVLNKDYHTKLKEVHDEILKKQRVRKLRKDTINILQVG